MSKESTNWMENRMKSQPHNDQSPTSNPVVPKENQENDDSFIIKRRGPKEEPPIRVPHYLTLVDDHWEPTYDDDDDNDDPTSSDDSSMQPLDINEDSTESDNNSYSLVDEFSYVIEDLVQEDFEIAEANMKARMKIA